MVRLETISRLSRDRDVETETTTLDNAVHSVLVDYHSVEVRCQSDVGVMSVSGRTDRQLPYCPGGHMCKLFLHWVCTDPWKVFESSGIENSRDFFSISVCF